RRRYDSASELVGDISRYLKDEPVIARRPSPMYRAGKFAKRHRAPLFASASVAVALGIGGLAGFLVLRDAAELSAIVLLPDLSKDGELTAVSRDATKGVVMDYSKGQNIALYDFSRKTRRLLTNLDWRMGWTYYAVWSPDAAHVAYVHVLPKDEAWEIR